MVEYRFLETLADQQLGRYLFDTVWPAPSEGTQIAPNFLQALMHSGSYLSGAFINGEIVGAAFGFPAKDGWNFLYSLSYGSCSSQPSGSRHWRWIKTSSKTMGAE